MAEILLVMALALGLAWPLGHYLARVLRGERGVLEPLVAPVEGLTYRLLGVDPRRGMSWVGYARAFAFSNAVLGLLVWLVLMFQHLLPLNPDAHSRHALGPGAAHHGVVPDQHQPAALLGPGAASYLSQLVGLVRLQVLTPMMGLGIAAAVLRGLFGGRNAATAAEGEAARRRQLLGRRHPPDPARVPAAVRCCWRCC